MKVVFKGVYETKRKGCHVCGARSAGTTAFSAVKTYYMPSGQTLTFRAGVPKDVSDSDAEFLLGFGCFEVV